MEVMRRERSTYLHSFGGLFGSVSFEIFGVGLGGLGFLGRSGSDFVFEDIFVVAVGLPLLAGGFGWSFRRFLDGSSGTLFGRSSLRSCRVGRAISRLWKELFRLSLQLVVSLAIMRIVSSGSIDLLEERKGPKGKE